VLISFGQKIYIPQHHIDIEQTSFLVDLLYQHADELVSPPNKIHCRTTNSTFNNITQMVDTLIK